MQKITVFVLSCMFLLSLFSSVNATLITIGTAGYDSDKLWNLDESSGNVALEKISDNTTIYF